MQIWMLQHENIDVKLLESIQRRAMKVGKDLGGKMYEELLRFVQCRAEELRGAFMAATAPHRE